MSEPVVIEYVQAMRRELVEHQAKVDRLKAQHQAQHPGAPCGMTRYLEGYGDAVRAMAEAFESALLDLTGGTT
jgi:hypothetical protein